MEGFGEARDGVGFEWAGAEGPGFVGAQGVLPWGRDVAEPAVGEADVEQGAGRARLFQFESGFGEDFTRPLGDADIANAEHLQRDLQGVGPVGEDQLIPRLDLDPGPELIGAASGEQGGGGGEGGGIRLPDGQGDFGGGVAQMDAVDVGESAGDAGDFLGEITGHTPDLGVGRLAEAWGSVVDVVDVAAGAVGKDGDEGWILALGIEVVGEFVAEGAKIVGADFSGTGSADVMERVIGEEREGTSVPVSDGEDEDLGIDGTGERMVVGAGRRPVHLHGIAGATQQIGIGAAGLDADASVEDVLGERTVGPADAGRGEVAKGAPDRIGDGPDDPAAVGGIGFGEVGADE